MYYTKDTLHRILFCTAVQKNCIIVLNNRILVRKVILCNILLPYRIGMFVSLTIFCSDQKNVRNGHCMEYI